MSIFQKKETTNQLELFFVWQEEVEIESKVVVAGQKGKLAMVVVEVRRKDDGKLIALAKQWLASVNLTGDQLSSKLWHLLGTICVHPCQTFCTISTTRNSRWLYDITRKVSRRLPFFPCTSANVTLDLPVVTNERASHAFAAHFIWNFQSNITLRRISCIVIPHVLMIENNS